MPSGTRTPLRNTAYGLIANAGLPRLYPLAAGSPDAIAVVPAAYTIAHMSASSTPGGGSVGCRDWPRRGRSARLRVVCFPDFSVPGPPGWSCGRAAARTQGVVVVLACVAGVGSARGSASWHYVVPRPVGDFRRSLTDSSTAAQRPGGTPHVETIRRSLTRPGRADERPATTPMALLAGALIGVALTVYSTITLYADVARPSSPSPRRSSSRSP